MTFVLQRPFTCPMKDCNSSYRRKDHLNRHLIQHQGKIFDCPFESCKSKFSFQGNMTRHVREIHDGSEDYSCIKTPKQHICSEPGCEKAFKYPSKLKKHEESHGEWVVILFKIVDLSFITVRVLFWWNCNFMLTTAVRLETIEALCGEPGCMKYFTNDQCLKIHIQTCHQHINCEVCGSKQLKKNIKRHLRTHAELVSKERIKCSFDGCNLTFTTVRNIILIMINLKGVSKIYWRGYTFKRRVSCFGF